MISTIAFLLGSLPILWVSRRSLLHPASHGFSRFFAFEAILALIVLNAPYWFTRAFGAQQLVSWLLLVVSGILVVWGVILLRRLGRSRPTTEGSPEFEWENTESLVTTGAYRYIRHPMYSALLFLAWGACLKSVSLITLLLAGVATLALAATAKAEEVENVARFGQQYRDYMKRTRRFVPFLL
ncbi:MAG: isoprenylcysteine carboxylmethyltransferase family protein [Gammaproteobacteria bacterium]|nr:isoprenylcysteine carboxylmethyltransferase family protein [Gammaproteobacteria bacterium]MBU2676636.1 isoprenylcysteine carboxylmethyltransferase family protein [Gammaproteobacteria bacterium]NNL50370.1 isoprenylcysteine carboxylmethyltransferase family protein [Woeseiaceae bacterium]